MAHTFPSLSQLAANFEDCEILQCAFTYKPTLSDWQTTEGQVGTILMATQYNPNAHEWVNKQQFLTQTGSTSSRVIDSAYHGVECDKSKLHGDGKFLVRTGPAPFGANLSDYDLGFMQMQVRDVPQANKTLGELHISYTIKLSKPRRWAALGKNLTTAKDIIAVGGQWSHDQSTHNNFIPSQSTPSFQMPMSECDLVSRNTGQPQLSSETCLYYCTNILSTNVYKSKMDSINMLVTTDTLYQWKYLELFDSNNYYLPVGANKLVFPAAESGVFDITLKMAGINMGRMSGSSVELGGGIIIEEQGNVVPVGDGMMACTADSCSLLPSQYKQSGGTQSSSGAGLPTGAVGWTSGGVAGLGS